MNLSDLAIVVPRFSTTGVRGTARVDECLSIVSSAHALLDRHCLRTPIGRCTDLRRLRLLEGALQPLRERIAAVPTGAGRRPTVDVAILRPSTNPRRAARVSEILEEHRLRALGALREALYSPGIAKALDECWNLDVIEQRQPLRLLRLLSYVHAGGDLPVALVELDELAAGIGEEDRPAERVAIVGEAPSRKHGPFAGPWYTRLATMAGLGRAPNLLLKFDLYNLLDEAQPREGKGSAFPADAGAARAAGLLPALVGRQVVFLGRRVADAFGTPERIPYLQWILGTDGIYAGFSVFPHPSGVDRWWNEVSNRERAEKFLRALVDGKEST